MIRSNFIDTRRIINNGKHSPVEYIPMQNLCGAIIEQAVTDWQEITGVKEICEYTKTVWVNQTELIEFFHSQWFEWMLGVVSENIKPETVRRALEIPEKERHGRKR